VTRAGVLRLGSVEVPRPLTELVQTEKGAFADRYLAGNVGGGVLRRYRLTFDYRHERLFLAPGPGAGEPAPFDRAGLWLELHDGGLLVEDVVPGGPGANAGIYPGDRVLGIAGETADAGALVALRDRLRSAPAGTKLRLHVSGSDGTHDVAVELADALGETTPQPAVDSPTGQLTPVPPSPQ
jgi:predicted metalloprotease with PDZ domain